MRKLYNNDEKTKTIGVRVPKSYSDILKNPIRNYTKMLVSMLNNGIDKRKISTINMEHLKNIIKGDVNDKSV